MFTNKHGVRTQARYLASHIWLSTHRKLTIQNAKCPFMPCACPSMVETWQIVCNVRENRVTKTHGADSYTHLRAHATRHELECRHLHEKKKKKKKQTKKTNKKKTTKTKKKKRQPKQKRNQTDRVQRTGEQGHKHTW